MDQTVRATELDIESHGLVLPNGLRLHHVKVSLPQTTMQFSPFAFPEGSRMNVEVVATANDLQNYLNEKNPGGLSNFRVTAEDGQIRVVGVMRMILPVEVGALGTLEFSDARLNFVPKRVEMAGAKAPAALVKEHLDKLNPLIDLSGWPVETNVKEITIGGGEIRLSASIVLTAPVPRREP
ncbi:MAG: LmeA family phospholipid-binding protein [Armatimonadetes bacterium]|nr:LmeA family phospholipid-binding protein [Armatimonadota bacterium]